MTAERAGIQRYQALRPATSACASCDWLRKRLKLFLRGIAADEPDALRHVGYGVIPIILVFNRDVALKTLRFEFVQHCSNFGDTRPVNDIRTGFANGGAFLQMRADNPSLKNLQTLERLQPGGRPMPGIRARADSRVAVLHQLGHVHWIPNLVAWI